MLEEWFERIRAVERTANTNNILPNGVCAYP
jgi:hypothetical protein